METEGLERVLDYIDTHISEKISLAELAELAGYSPFYFSRLFSRIMGISVTGYIRIRKLQHALSDLAEGNKVLDVSLRYGFDSHEGFTRAFTDMFGMAPSKAKRYLVSYKVPQYRIPDEYDGRMAMELQERQMDLGDSLHELIFEVLRTSLEEAEEGFCTKIEVVLHADCSVRIADNGRGIPLTQNTEKDREVLDRIFSGYPLSGPACLRTEEIAGYSLKTVNSLCESLKIRTYRDGFEFWQEYIRGIAQHEVMSEPCDHESGTEILFRPDRAVFGEKRISADRIREWVRKQTGERNTPVIQIREED